MNLTAKICIIGIFLFGAILTQPLVAGSTTFPETVAVGAYPFSSSVRASVSSAFLGIYAPDLTVREFEVRPERARVRFFENRHRLPVGFLPQPDSTRLLIVIPGLGGDAQSGMAGYLAGKAHQWGYNVLTVPSPLSWRFALGASRAAYPGYTPYDVQDLLPLIQKSLKHFKKRFGVTVRSVSVLGYSLGGLHAAHLALQVEEVLGVSLERAVLINSPVDVVESAVIVDEMYRIGEPFSEVHIAHIFGNLMQLFGGVEPKYFVPEYVLFAGLEKSLKLSDRDLTWVIGRLFREDLTGVLYTSQQVKERGVLKTPITWGRRTPRQEEARQYSFQRYMSQVVAPWVASEQPLLTSQGAITQAGLLPLSERFQQDRRFVFFHTADDFLTTTKSMQWALETFGERAIYYDRGGHLGQVWTAEFQTDLAKELGDITK